MGFGAMCSSWAKGTDDFRKSVLEYLKDDQLSRVVEAEASEMREPRWEQAVVDMLS
jgi:hypothetical protein